MTPPTIPIGPYLAMNAANKNPTGRPAPSINLSDADIDRILARSKELAAPAQTPTQVPSPPQLFSKAQWTAIATMATLLLGSVGGGSYFGVASSTAAEVAARDESNKRAVTGQLDLAMGGLDKRLDALSLQVVEIKEDVKATSASVIKIEEHMAVLKDRDARKK